MADYESELPISSAYDTWRSVEMPAKDKVETTINNFSRAPWTYSIILLVIILLCISKKVTLVLVYIFIPEPEGVE